MEVIGGSGITAENALDLMMHLDGAIVGSSLKVGSHWSGPVDQAKVEALVARVSDLRGSV